MNNRIRLLAEQAGFNMHNDLIDGHNFNYEIEKLANIIIFECIKIAVFSGDPATGKAIKENFEVVE
jgi:hypothetical protein